MSLTDNDSAFKLISDQLVAFAKLDNFWNLFEIAFGKEYNQAVALRLRSQWQAGDFSNAPEIEVISSSVLGGANGAYAISTNKIYLSDTFVESATTNSLTVVLLEEYGHFVDAQINQADTAGVPQNHRQQLVSSTTTSHPCQLQVVSTSWTQLLVRYSMV